MSKKNIHVLELASYQAPIIQESKRENWVEFGEDNNYYSFLIDCYTNSTTNNAIINNCSRMIYGKGLSATDASRKPNEYAHMMALFSKKDVKQLVSDLKMLGQCAMQVIYTKDRKKIAEVHHVPVQLLRAEKCNEDGEITGYYYSDDWSDIKKYVPKRIPGFGYSQENSEIYFIKPYSVGLKYYALPDYTGGLPYCTLEESVSEYLINEVNNGFSSRSVINFNNGQPSEEQQMLIKNRVMSQLTGTKGEKLIVSFNSNAESKTTVDAMPVNDAPDLYNTLSEECLRKIMLSHNITSPLLFGIASSNGFSSNADELKDSFILFHNLVILPFQNTLLDGFEQILAYNSINLNIYFKTLKPLEFTDLETGSVNPTSDDINLSQEYVGQQLIELGEEPSKEWLLLDEFEVDYDTDEEENISLSRELKEKLSFKDRIVNLLSDVSTGQAYPNARSASDRTIDGIRFITRYKYAGKTSTTKSRDFCTNMMAKDKIYRKEDIMRMGKQEVNPGWGPRGINLYSIWKYKGGGNCYHRWNKQVYVSFAGTGIDVRSPKAAKIAQKKAARYGYVIRNDSKVSQRPIDMPNEGFFTK